MGSCEISKNNYSGQLFVGINLHQLFLVHLRTGLYTRLSYPSHKFHLKRITTMPVRVTRLDCFGMELFYMFNYWTSLFMLKNSTWRYLFPLFIIIRGLANLGNNQEAIKYYDKAIEHDPNHGHACFNRASIRILQRD